MTRHPHPHQPDDRPCALLGIWAHPDDEAYLSAGLMARTTAGGGRVHCQHATDGELGTSDPATWPPERLGPHRRRELDRSLAVLGVHDHEFMGYPDGGCDLVDLHEAIDRLSDVIARLRPRVIVTFGPDGITGHPDHVAVSRWTTAAWASVGVGDLLYATSTESFMQRFAAVHRGLGLFAEDAPRIDDADVDLEVELDARELRIKRGALAAHASQTASLAAQMGEATYRRWYAVETFRRPTAADVHAAVMVAAS